MSGEKVVYVSPMEWAAEIAAAEKRGADRVIARVEALCDKHEQLVEAQPWSSRWPAMAYTHQIRAALRGDAP